MALIMEFEGFCAFPYICPAGKLTIGFGHVISASENVDLSRGVSLAEAKEILRKDVLIAQEAIHTGVTVPLQQQQFDALASFIYNIGTAAFGRSTLLKLLNKGDFYAAGAQLLCWDNVSGRKNAGLARRRAAELALFNQKVEPS